MSEYQREPEVLNLSFIISLALESILKSYAQSPGGRLEYYWAKNLPEEVRRAIRSQLAANAKASGRDQKPGIAVNLGSRTSRVLYQETGRGFILIALEDASFRASLGDDNPCGL